MWCNVSACCICMQNENSYRWKYICRARAITLTHRLETANEMIIRQDEKQSSKVEEQYRYLPLHINFYIFVTVSIEGVSSLAAVSNLRACLVMRFVCFLNLTLSMNKSAMIFLISSSQITPSFMPLLLST